MGKHGLSCDNVLSADLVSADGSHMSVSASKNGDLFWAIRGGGGNFGIVTALEFRLHALESVHGGLLLYPRGRAVDLLRRYRDVTAIAPDELTAHAAQSRPTWHEIQRRYWLLHHGSVLVLMRARDAPFVVIRAIRTLPIVDCLDAYILQFICAKTTQRR